MQSTISRAVAREYENRRFQAERARDIRLEGLYNQYPELAQLDRAIATAGADQILEAIDPERPREAAARKAALIRERESLLGRLNIDPDYDWVQFQCQTCQDTGMVGRKRCSCYRKVLIPLLQDNANLRSLSGLKFDQFDESLFSDQPNPERHQSKLSPRQHIGGLKQAARRFIDEFDRPETRNLLFVGSPGTGKTFLMACIANSLLETGRSVLYLSAPKLFEVIAEHRTLLAAFNPDPIRFEKAGALYDSLMTCDLLLIDDLGTEAGAASRYADLLTVLDERSVPGLRTIVSSNANPATLRDTYDERLLSRLLGGFAVYRFFGDDVRIEQSRRRRKG